MVTLNCTPENYEYWLAESIRRTTAERPAEDGLVFINAWNEWAEGCHLEPDRQYQHQFLEATLRASTLHSQVDDFRDKGLSAQHPAAVGRRVFFHDLMQVLRYHAGPVISQMKMCINRIPWLRAAVLPVMRLEVREMHESLADNPASPLS